MSRIWVAVSKTRITIARTEPEAQQMRDHSFSPDEVLISCRDLKFDGGSAGGHPFTRLQCTDASFTAGNGLTGSAGQLLFDMAGRTLELRGTGKQQVKLTYKFNSVEQSQFVASEVRISFGGSRVKIRGANDSFTCEFVIPKALKSVSYEVQSPYGANPIPPASYQVRPVYVQPVYLDPLPKPSSGPQRPPGIFPPAPEPKSKKSPPQPDATKAYR